MLKLLGGGSLSLGVQILNLGLTEDAVTLVSIWKLWVVKYVFSHPGVTTRRLVDVGIVNDEEDLAKKKKTVSELGHNCLEYLVERDGGPNNRLLGDQIPKTFDNGA